LTTEIVDITLEDNLKEGKEEAKKHPDLYHFDAG
jgi:hypothetical protein